MELLYSLGRYKMMAWRRWAQVLNSTGDALYRSGGIMGGMKGLDMETQGREYHGKKEQVEKVFLPSRKAATNGHCF
jgi:hypothetical protein